MGMRLGLLGVGCAAVAVALLGCPKKSPSKECQFHSDCGTGRICTAGRCVDGCLTDRDCGANLRCLSGSCEFSVLDAGPIRDASVPTDAAVNPTVGVEESCAATLNVDCQPGLACTRITGVGDICLPSCASSADGGITQATCETGRMCNPSGTPGVGVCVRTVGRDELCVDQSTGMVDPLLACGPGLTRLSDTQMTLCACKLLCTFSTCPGPDCVCAASESCVEGVVNSTTQGACGTQLPLGATCDDPFDYPFGTSQYCAPAPGVPAASRPYPYCSFDENFDITCQYICLYPPLTSNLGCPSGTLCLDTAYWGEGYKTCQSPARPDAGVLMPDAGSPDAATPSSSSSSGTSASSPGTSLPSSGVVDSSSALGASSSGGAQSSSELPVSSSSLQSSSL